MLVRLKRKVDNNFDSSFHDYPDNGQEAEKKRAILNGYEKPDNNILGF